MNIFAKTKAGKIQWPTPAKNQFRQWAQDNPNCEFYVTIHRMPKKGRTYTREYYFAGVVWSLREYVKQEGDIWSEQEGHDFLKAEYGIESTKDLSDQEYWEYVLWAREKVMKISDTFVPAPKVL